jgi:hypothetical protein
MRRRAASVALLVAAATAACRDAPPATTSTDDLAATTPTTSTTATSVAPSAATSAASSTVPSTVPPAGSAVAPGSVAPVEPTLALARRLEVAERGIRDEGVSAAERAAHGRDQQAAYRAVGADRELVDLLPSLVAEDVRVAVSFNLAARAAVLDHAAARAAEGPVPEPPATLPAWTIVEPLPADELLGLYREAEALTGVEWEYLAAIHLVETRMGRIVGPSTAGAIGPMQFLPDTWAACCEGDPTVPRDAIIGAATYLVDRGAPGDMDAALYGYNPNRGYVGSVTAYAANLRADERAYAGYHAWEVYVATTAGTVRLPVGYAEPEPIDAAAWLAANPDAARPRPAG